MTYRLEAKLRGYIHGVFPTKLSELENDVPYVSAADGQELTDGQQRAALENVNATEILAENFVRHDVATELSEEAQKVARDNIGTYGKAEIDERIWNIEVDFLEDANKYADEKVGELAERTAASLQRINEEIGDEEYQGFDTPPTSIKNAINKLAKRKPDGETIVEADDIISAVAIKDETSDGEKTVTPQTIVDLEKAAIKIAADVDRLKGRGGFLTPYNFEWDGVSESVQVGDTFNESRNGVKTEITVVADGSGNYPTGTNINLTDAYKKAVDWQIDLMDWATFDIWGAINRKYGTEGLNEVAEGQRITLSVKSITAQTEPFCEIFGTDADGNSYGVYQQDGKLYFGSFTYDTELQTVTAIESDELWDGVSALKPFRKDYNAPKGIVLNASIERPFGGDSGLSWEENLIVWEKDFYEIFNGTRVINTFNNWEMELTNTQDTEPPVCSWATAGIDQGINYADDDTGGIVRTGQTTGEGASRVYGVQLNDITKQMYVSELGEDLAEITQNVEDRVEKVPSAVENNIAVFDSNGGIKDNNIKASDFATAAQGQKADSAYQKPSGGIPATDLAQGVRDSLALADSALQSVPDATATQKGVATLGAAGGAARYGQKSDVGLSNVDNVKQYSASNPPPYPVTSVAGRTGDVTLTKADVALDNVANERQYSANNPPPYPVTSVAGKTGVVTLAKADVGLGNVDNTADLDKPISTATQTALNTKVGNTGSQSITGDLTIVKSGDSSGNMVVQGDLTVQGTTITTEAESLIVHDNLIVTNSEGTSLTNLSGLAIKTDADNAYGIVYDPTTQSVKLGEGTISAENELTFNEGEGAAVATRADSSELTDGHLLQWDATKNTLVDGGKMPETLPNPAALTIGQEKYDGSVERSVTPEKIGAEPAFAKNTAFNKNFGTSADTVAQGNDSRIVSAVQSAMFSGVALEKSGTQLSISQESARTALGLGTAAYTNASDYATATQGARAEEAYQTANEAQQAADEAQQAANEAQQAANEAQQAANKAQQTANGAQQTANGAQQTANEAKSIAEGRSQAKVFDDEEAMEAWLAVPTNTETLNVGDSLLIRAVDSPDYWWDGTSAQVLETEKVDLTDYYTKAEVDDALGNKIDSVSLKAGAANGQLVLTVDGQDATPVSVPGLGSAAYTESSAYATSAQGQKADSAYQKPSAGIPATDLAQGVQDSLALANSAYQKPSGGIPNADLAQGVQNSLGLADSALQGITAGDNITIDTRDPKHPVINSTGGGISEIEPLTIQLNGAGGVVFDGSEAQSVNITAAGVGAEPTIATKGTAFNKDFGTTAGTVMEGNDSRVTGAVQSVTFAGTELTKTVGAAEITQSEARAALGLGSAAYTASTAYATAAQGQKADSAYQKPSGGIPATDLAQGVRDSLALADSALQSVPDATATQKGVATLGASGGAARYGQKNDVGLGNVDNVKQYSASNPPPYPVTSVAGRTGAVTLAKADVGLSNVQNVDQTNASNITSGSLAVNRIAAGLVTGSSPSASVADIEVTRTGDGVYEIEAGDGLLRTYGTQSLKGSLTIVKEGEASTGNLVVQGDLTVQGTTITTEAESLVIHDNLIVTNSEGADLTNLSGIAIKVDGTNTYGIVYDPVSQSVKLGEGTLSEDNELTFNSNEGTAVATRSDSTALTNGHLLQWDGTRNIIVDGGAKPTALPNPHALTLGRKVYNGSSAVTLLASDINAEPAFAKNTAFNKNFGTTAGTVAQGNDSRITGAVQSATFAGTAFTKTGTTIEITQTAARTALGLGSAAYTNSNAYATSAQGKKADSAYQKPSAGIPATDLAQGVRDSLALADSALQSVPDATATQKGVATLGASGGAARYGQKSDVGLSNVANVLQYSANNPPPYPVTSVAGRTGVVTLTRADVGLSNLANERQYSTGNPPPYPVTSVAGKKGAVTLTKADVGLGSVDNVKQYSASNPPPYPVTSVAGRTGAVTLTKADVGLNNVANERQYSANNPPTLLKGQDTRNANDPPSTYMSKGSAVVVNEFKITSVVGANSVLSGEYCQVTTYNPWTDSTGGYPVQVATSSFSNGAIAVRTGTSNTAWGPWYKVYTTGNKPTASDVGAQATITKSTTSGTAYLLASNSATGSLGSTVYTNSAVYISSGTRVNATTFSANSDRRLKKHIKRASFDENRSILDVPIKSYEWKDTGEKAVGFIAQELEKVYPELVITEESGYKSIKESKFIYYLMHEVKKLKDEVQTLKAKLGE